MLSNGKYIDLSQMRTFAELKNLMLILKSVLSDDFQYPYRPKKQYLLRQLPKLREDQQGRTDSTVLPFVDHDTRPIIGAEW